MTNDAFAHRRDRIQFGARLSALALVFALIAAPSYGQNAGARATAQPQNAPRQASAKPEATPTSSAAQPTADAETPALSPEEQEKFKSALASFNKQDFSGALAALREISTANPAARPPRVVLASWFAELQNAKAARLSLEMATEEDPTDPEAYYSLAEISLREGELTAAELLTIKGDQLLAAYDANAKRRQNMTRASFALKLAYSNARQRWADAQSAILGLIKADGETEELDRAYARALFQQNQDEKARQMFQRAEKVSKNETPLPADVAMAQLYAARGDADKAKESVAAALKANPNSQPALLLSISLALTENNLDSAQQLAQRLYAENKSADVLKTYGKVALFRSDYKTAEAAFQEAARLNPLDADAASGLALALCEQGDPEKCKRAVQYAASNLQKQSNNRDFLATLGWTLYMSGQKDEAFKVLQQSIADGQINAASAYYLAVVLNEKGQTETARQLLTAAVGTKPPFAKRAAAEKLLSDIAKKPAATPAPAQNAPQAPNANQGANRARATQPRAVANAPGNKVAR